MAGGLGLTLRQIEVLALDFIREGNASVAEKTGKVSAA
jgi:hypothetical protein